VQDLSSAVDLLVWSPALWRTSIITDSPLSFYPKIHSNYRLPLGRAQGGRILPEVSERTAASVPRLYLDRDHQESEMATTRSCESPGDSEARGSRT
jgi:hypothetical protein